MATGPKTRTISFFRLAWQAGDSPELQRFTQQIDWEALLLGLSTEPLQDRTVERLDERYVGAHLVVDQRYTLKLLKPRDEASWLEILDTQGDSKELKINGELVETSIVVFLDVGKNLIGVVRGSTSAPSAAAVADWLTDRMHRRGGLPAGGAVVAEPAMSHAQERMLRTADGASSATVRITAGAASQLHGDSPAVSRVAELARSLRDDWGDIVIEVTYKAPRGKAGAAARQRVLEEARELNALTDQADALKANLVYEEEGARARSEEIDFHHQRLTAKASIPTSDEDGSPIRNESAVRAILAEADRLGSELRQL